MKQYRTAPITENGEEHSGASHNSTDNTQSAKYSCMLVVGEVENTFTITITHEYMLINGFKTDEALATVEGVNERGMRISHFL